MGIKRVVDTQFWNDDKVLDMFSPEDKLFMLYLMTNPHTTQLGIYSINIKHMAFEIGYSTDTIKVLLDRFENKYKIIKYSYDSKEIAIKNYLKHSIIKGGAPVRDCLIKELKRVKNRDLIVYVFSNLKDDENINDTVKNLIKEYEEKNGELVYCNVKEKSNKKENNINEIQNENENDNDNEVSYPVSLDDTLDDTLLEKEFEELWIEYPNKQGKENALKAYIKARKKDTRYDDVFLGLRNYKNYIEKMKTQKQFIKHGSTWFNQKCWKDDYEIDNSDGWDYINDEFNKIKNDLF